MSNEKTVSKLDITEQKLLYKNESNNYISLINNNIRHFKKTNNELIKFNNSLTYCSYNNKKNEFKEMTNSNVSAYNNFRDGEFRIHSNNISNKNIDINNNLLYTINHRLKNKSITIKPIENNYINKLNNEEDIINTKAINNCLTKLHNNDILNNEYNNNLNYKLPKKKDYVFKNGNITAKNKMEESIIETIKQELFLWDINDNNFVLNLPSTIFNSKINIKFLNNSDVDIAYSETKNNKDRLLNSTQFKDIFLKARFKVESKIPELPYEWYITSWIIKGAKNIYNDFCDAISISFLVIYKIKDRFKNSKNFSFSFYSSLYALYESLYHLVSVIISIPSFEYIKDDKLTKNNLKKEFTETFINENNDFDYNLFIPEVKEQVNYLSNLFEEFWKKEAFDITTKYYEEKYTEEEIKYKLYNLRIEKLLLYIDQCDNNNKNLNLITNKIKDLVKQYYLAHIIINKHYSTKNIKEKEIKESIECLIHDKYVIRSKVSEWKINKINKIQNFIISQLKDNLNNDIINEMKNLNLNQPIILFEKSINYEKAYKKAYNYNLEISKVKIPSRVYYIKLYYHMHKGCCFENSNICDDNYVYINKNINMSKIYVLNNSYNIKISPNVLFWKYILYLFKYISFVNNIAIYSFKSIFNNKFGLNSFFQNEVVINYECNPTTGIITKGETHKTLKFHLNKLINSIVTNRKEFEDSPDNSLLGKSCARLFNIFYNYIIKLFVAFFVFILGYSFVILTLCLFWFLIMITCFIWAFFGIILHFIFNIFIYDVYHPKENSTGYGILPIIFYLLLIKFMFQFIATLIITLSHPIIALLIFLLGVIRLIVRFAYDIFMFFIIYIFAKLPISDSFIAWKISGPGISKMYYNHIDLKDAIIIIHGSLEKYELIYYKSKIFSLLEEPLIKLNSLNNRLYLFDLKLNSNLLIEESIEYYKYLIDYNVSKRLQIYPSCTNVKFTNDELIILRIISRDYIKNYVKSHDFEHIFKMFNISDYEWGLLTDLILKSAFDEDILQSLEENDYRIEIKKEENNYYTEIKNIIVNKCNLNEYLLNTKQKQKRINYNICLDNIQLKDICDQTVNRKLFLDLSLLDNTMLKLIKERSIN